MTIPSILHNWSIFKIKDNKKACDDLSLDALVMKYIYKALGGLLLLVLACRQQCAGQVFPKEGSALYYRIIGFSCPAQSWAVRYGVEIAVGNYTDEGAFVKNVSQTINSKSSKIIGEVPFFGGQYTWRIVFVMKDSSRKHSILYHFSTRMSPDVDTAVTRLRVTKAAEKYKDGYVFLDGARVLYDMKGKPVWFLPGSDVDSREAYPRDIKLSPAGSITFNTGNKPYEINWNGEILWKYQGNNSSVTDSFHHQFTRLDNGHYMAMRFEAVYERLPAYRDSVARTTADSSRYFKRSKYSYLVEFDADNRVVWRWRTYDYALNSDLKTRDPYEDTGWSDGLHDNSFYFDEPHGEVYLSLRNISRIIRIKYPEGTVLNEYGTKYRPGMKNWDNELFCMQHSCRVNDKGELYLYDNNTCGTSPIPKVLVMQQPGPGSNTLKKIWEYQCTIEDKSIAAEKPHFRAGGNVMQLPDRSMFVSMNTPYCKVFIVSHDKKILWSALPEKYDAAERKWKQSPELYRASIITGRKALEELIWNSEK